LFLYKKQYVGVKVRILALDYGDKNIGVAVCDPLGITAQGLETIRRENELSIKKSVSRIGVLLKQYEIQTILLGYPKNMDNTEGFRCEKTILFKERLERNFKKIPVILWDERLSTMGAYRGACQYTKKKQSLMIDELSAVFILQGYLQFLNNNNEV
jgi:putative holliday junction resolvase